MCLYPDERREAQENTSMRSWEFPRKLPGLNADNFLFSLTQAKVQTFPISEFYVALAIPIAIAVYKEIAISKAIAKKIFILITFLVMEQQ